jgi:hypothetical protein
MVNSSAWGGIANYEPDVDISMGTYNYFFNSGDSNPNLKTGVYFGGYLGMKSPLFSFFFNAQNFYSMYESGVAINNVENNDDFILTIPFVYDLSYRIRLFKKKKLTLKPFIGTGFNLVRFDTNGGNWDLYYLLDTGFEVQYPIWRKTNLKLKINYGIMFVDTVDSGYVHFLRVRFPVPFIP